MQNKTRLVYITRKNNGRAKSKEFTCQFWEPGLVSYEDAGLGKALLRKEVMDKIAPTFVDKPVIIEHQDGEPEELFENGAAVGEITGVRWNGETGWYECDFTAKTQEAADKIEKEGWSVSCAFDSNDNGPGGQYHAIDYRFEIMGGEGIHLALVPNPRYEDSKIFTNSGLMLINSKKATTVKENEKRKCSRCGRVFLSTSRVPENCPDCSSSDSVKVKENAPDETVPVGSKTAGDPPETVPLENATFTAMVKDEKGELQAHDFEAKDHADAEMKAKAKWGKIEGVVKNSKKNSPKHENTERRVRIKLTSRNSKEKQSMKNTVIEGILKIFGKKQNSKDNSFEGTVDHKNSYVMIDSEKVSINDLLNAQEEMEAELKNDEGTEELPITNGDEMIKDGEKEHKIADLMENYKNRKAKKANAQTDEEKAADSKKKEKKENEDGDKGKKEDELTIQKQNGKPAEKPARSIKFFQNMQSKRDESQENLVNTGTAFETMADKVSRGKSRYGSAAK